MCVPDHVSMCECVSIPFIGTHTWVVKMPLTHCSHDDEYEIYLHEIILLCCGLFQPPALVQRENKSPIHTS